MNNFNPFLEAHNSKLINYEHNWVNFVRNGKINYSVIRKEVVDSWKRCKDIGLDPYTTESLAFIDKNQLKKRIKNNSNLIYTACSFMKSLYKLVKGSNFRVDIADKEGYILKSIGDKEILNFSKKTNSFPGANLSENASGTNSISLAIIHKKPFQISGAEHYLHIFQEWTCSAAPIFDDKKELIGILNIAGRFELVHHHTLCMAISTAKAIENELKLQKTNLQLDQNNSKLKATLNSITDGIIYINNEGLITQINFKIEKLLDINADKIIGKKAIDIINSSPSLDTILNSADILEHYEIIIHGKNNDYNCLLNVKRIYNEKNEINGIIFIFTHLETIQKLANPSEKNIAYFTFDNIIGQSAKFKKAINLAKKAAGINFRVIIQGESGTGKEMFAQAIHNNSSRQNKPFIAVDCGAIPRELLESELFGYERGSFTGARKEGKAGKFELANGGTLFLDEIGNMPIEMQIKMLRVLQENQVTRIGGEHPIPIDVRIIAATNADLKEEVEKNNFREDLFYRLNVFYIKIPPLRERKEDIPILVDHFLENNPSPLNKKKIDNKAMAVFQSYSWPGNVRQLHNVIERSMVMAKKNCIKVEDLPPEIVHESYHSIKNTTTKIIPLEDATTNYILKTLEITNGNISKAADMLKISRTTVYNFIKKTGPGRFSI